MGMSLKPQIKPLLSGLVDRMKYEFSKPYILPILPIKTKYQNAEKLRPSVWAPRKLLQSSVPTTTLRALKLAMKLTFDMPKNGSSNVERKSLFNVCFKYFDYINFIWHYSSNIYFKALASAYDRDMQPHAFLAMWVLYHERNKRRLAVDKKTLTPMLSRLMITINEYSLN